MARAPAVSAVSAGCNFLKRWSAPLRARIPAVTWEICPDFSSAESLGAEVNTAQTSRYYRALLTQDPGERILRPQYVNECAHRGTVKTRIKTAETSQPNRTRPRRIAWAGFPIQRTTPC